MADLHLQHETGGGAAVTTTKNYYNWEVADMNQVYEAVDIECGRIQSLNYWKYGIIPLDVKLRLIERALFKEKSSNSHLIRARSTRNFDELILKLADFVVKRLGGPVVNFGELRKRWARRRSQLQVGLKTPVLPICSLDVGLSRHRALLFKVLADSIHIPSTLVRLDDEAVNLITASDGRDYIVNMMMGACCTLIPAEGPIRIQNYRFAVRDFAKIAQQPYNLHPMPADRRIKLPEWEVRWEDLCIADRIGFYSHSEVYLAVDCVGNDVAVWKLQPQDVVLDLFESEIEIMRKLQHPNVVRFVGAITSLARHFSILTEFLPRGSLFKLLHCSDLVLDKERRLRMALAVAEGMDYLHTRNPPIVHQDLNTTNLLVDRHWDVKVCYFGVSCMKYSCAGKPEWMAPEVFSNTYPVEKWCDVYSFGVILWELTTMQIPWPGMDHTQVSQAVGLKNMRLEIPKDVDTEVARVIQDCWHTKPDMRPSFKDLILRLSNLCQQYQKVEILSHETLLPTFVLLSLSPLYITRDQENNNKKIKM